MNNLVRRSVSTALLTSASKRAISTALFTSDPLRLSPATPSEPFSTAGYIQPFLASKAVPENTYHGGIWRRCLHFASRPLGIRATDAASAQAAVAELYDEDNLGTDEEEGDEGLDIAKLGIAEEIVSRLARKGITKLFPIQRAVLEPAMKGRDMIARAKTGTGKTLAFGIPIMNKIIRFNAKNGKQRNPLALVLAPTRELARQVEKEFCESSNLDTLCVYGGVPIQRQISALHQGVDAVIGTPGRIIDLLKRGALNLSEVQFVVLDEADQMLAVGFDEDVEMILDKLSPKRQSMMFSATMPPWIRKLTQKYLKSPVTIDLVGENDQKLAEGITLYSIATDQYSKPSVLNALIKEHAKGGKCIVFTQTKRDADRLARAMGQSFGCQPLHGDIPQGDRERTLSGFRAGQFNVLIATDVAARGLDIPNVDLVIHYELPNNSELFVHRSGRTGRAGKKGSAIVIYTQDKKRMVREVEHDVGCKFKELPTIEVEGGVDMFGSMGGRFDSDGGRRRIGDSSFGRGGNGSFGGSNYGRRDNFGDRGSSQFGRGRSGNTSSPRSSFGNSGYGRPGNFGSSSQGNSFGGSGSNKSWWQ